MSALNAAKDQTCNECGRSALYWDKGWEDELGGEVATYWCEEHKHFKAGAERLYQFIPRSVYFKDGICIGAGFCSSAHQADQMEIIALPTDHYDFLGPINVLSKTKEQIEQEISKYLL